MSSADTGSARSDVAEGCAPSAILSTSSQIRTIHASSFVSARESPRCRDLRMHFGLREILADVPWPIADCNHAGPARDIRTLHSSKRGRTSPEDPTHRPPHPAHDCASLRMPMALMTHCYEHSTEIIGIRNTSLLSEAKYSPPNRRDKYRDVLVDSHILVRNTFFFRGGMGKKRARPSRWRPVWR